MKALIEKHNNNRIAQVEPDYLIFPVATGFEWVTCPDDCKTDWSFDDCRFKPPVLPVITAEAQQEYFTQLACEMMDKKVKERHYDGIISACSYVGSTNERYSFEAMACMAWRDKVWARCFEIFDALKAGRMEIPSKEDFLAMLPSFAWPEEITE